MLTGPIFSQEEEEEMMNLSGFRDRERINESQEQSRGTIILEGEDGEDIAEAPKSPGEMSLSHPHVVPQECSREEYEFSFDFTAPTHVYSLQFSPPEQQEDGCSQREEAIDAQHFAKKNQVWCWVALAVFMSLCGIQQILLVKNDLAALRLENERLRTTVDILQQEKQRDSESQQEQTFQKVFDHGFSSDASTKLGECAIEAKNQLYHHLLDLKETFWMTAEHIRDVIEEELIGSLDKEEEEEEEEDASKEREEESGIKQWFHKHGVAKRVEEAFQRIGGAKVLVPMIFVSGVSLAVDWFWRDDD